MQNPGFPTMTPLPEMTASVVTHSDLPWDDLSLFGIKFTSPRTGHEIGWKRFLMALFCPGISLGQSAKIYFDDEPGFAGVAMSAILFVLAGFTVYGAIGFLCLVSVIKFGSFASLIYFLSVGCSSWLAFALHRKYSFSRPDCCSTILEVTFFSCCFLARMRNFADLEESKLLKPIQMQMSAAI
jgi:hypothetical protein